MVIVPSVKYGGLRIVVVLSVSNYLIVLLVQGLFFNVDYCFSQGNGSGLGVSQQHIWIVLQTSLEIHPSAKIKPCAALEVESHLSFTFV